MINVANFARKTFYCCLTFSYEIKKTSLPGYSQILEIDSFLNKLAVSNFRGIDQNLKLHLISSKINFLNVLKVIPKRRQLAIVNIYVTA